MKTTKLTKLQWQAVNGSRWLTLTCRQHRGNATPAPGLSNDHIRSWLHLSKLFALANREKERCASLKMDFGQMQR